MTDSFPPPLDTEENEIIASFKAGDVAVFERIYLRYYEELCSYASTLVSDDESCDVVQDVLWTVWNNREQLSVRNAKQLSYYLIRAVRNRAVDLLRHRHMRDGHSLLLGEAFEAPLSIEEDNGDDKDTLRERVQDVIDMLPPRSREILMLRWYHGFGLDEIASLMHISYGSARVLHTRALAMVRDRLGL